MMIGLRRDHQAVAARGAWTEFPHQPRVDALQCLFHPRDQVPLALTIEYPVEVFRLCRERFPPGVDLGADHDAARVLLWALAGGEELPTHRAYASAGMTGVQPSDTDA